MITQPRVEQLLRETFQEHEHLAEELPVHVAPSRRSGRVLVAIAAAATVAVGGLTVSAWLAGQDDITTLPLGPRPSKTGSTHGRDLRTDAENRADTVILVQRALRVSQASIEDLPGGAEAATADEVASLKRLNSFIGGGNQVIRSEFFLAASPDHTTLAQFLVAHPADGFTTDGAEAGDPNGGIGGGRLLDGSWADELFWNPGTRFATESGSVALLVQLTPVGDRTGIRVTAFGSWIPARPAESFLDEPVTSIDLSYRPGVEGVTRGPNPKTRQLTVTGHRVIDRLVSVFNSMTGWPEFFHSCPYSGRPEEIRATFHTADQDLTTSWVGSCYQVWEVTSAGHRVGPYLADTDLASMIKHLTT